MTKLLLPVVCLLFISGFLRAQSAPASADSTARQKNPYRLIPRSARPAPAPGDSTPRRKDPYRLIQNRPAPGERSAPRTSAPTVAAPSAASVPSGRNVVKNIDNGITFTVTACTGNVHDQTVTMFFTFSNPSKPHQQISLSFRKYGALTNALDRESNEYAAGQITLGGESNSNAYRASVKQLPTGNVLKGSITFINILPAVNQFSLVNILTESCNSAGGSDKKSGLIEVQNVPVTWAATN